MVSTVRHAELFSLQDELCRFLFAPIWNHPLREVVIGCCNRGLTISRQDIIAFVLSLTSISRRIYNAEKSVEESRQEGR